MNKEVTHELIKNGCIAVVGYCLLKEFGGLDSNFIPMMIPYVIGLSGLTLILYFAWD